MTAELGLNLAGVERVLDLEAEVEEMHARIEELELEALHAQVRLAEELEEVRRSFRAELGAVSRRTRSCARRTRARRSARETAKEQAMAPNGPNPATAAHPPRRSRARSSASGATSPRWPSGASSTR